MYLTRYSQLFLLFNFLLKDFGFKVLKIQIKNQCEFPYFCMYYIYQQCLWSFLNFKLYWVWLDEIMNSRIFVALFSTFQVLEIQVWNKFEFPIFIWYSQGLWSFLYFKLYWVWPSVIKHLCCCYMKILDLRFKYKSTISMKFLIFVWYSQFLWSYLNFKSYWVWPCIVQDLCYS